MNDIRHPAVSGAFYPSDPDQLTSQINQFLDHAKSQSTVPKAIIVPHAGYQYSGAIAANAYHLLKPVKQKIKRVVMLGPSHHFAFAGIATCSSVVYRTPLGDIPIDHEEQRKLLQLDQVNTLDQAHLKEHSLEVQLPFLQILLDDFKLIPLVVGDASKKDISAALELVWNDDDTLIVVSSDLSHYLPYDEARQKDFATSNAIKNFDGDQIHRKDACGRNSIKGLLHCAKKKHMTSQILDVRNSGDTSGTKNRVVGYGSYAFH